MVAGSGCIGPSGDRLGCVGIDHYVGDLIAVEPKSEPAVRIVAKTGKLEGQSRSGGNVGVIAVGALHAV